MFSNLARPPTASSVSFGLKPVAVTFMVTSLGRAGGGTGAVGAALLPHAATLSATMQPDSGPPTGHHRSIVRPLRAQSNGAHESEPEPNRKLR